MHQDPPPRRVSLREIARQLGVSHVTVSLALRDSPQISAAVREKVKKLAEELGYRPDPMLSALSSYRLGKVDPSFRAVIGWINAWPEPGQLRAHEEFDAYWKGASNAAGKLGYQLEEFRVGRSLSPSRLHQILSTRGIQGLLLPPHAETPEWAEFPWEKYFVVRYGRSLQTPNSHLVTADQMLNTMLAFGKIREQGYRRIGFVTIRREPEISAHTHLFKAGFLVSQQLLDEKDRIPVLTLSAEEQQDSAPSFCKWMKRHRPDAIFTDVGWIRNLLEHSGLSIPVAATTLIDTGIDTGIDQHPEEIGRVGMLLLNSIINDGAIGIPSIFRQILVEGHWVQGTSLPPKA
ncbi:MAG: LacI family transcriptional regulator [Verrucomicrobiaceae bacterium]|nr:MAG: LacI family transcriptional regulator [Verrucomicrobiaceae bacterium]